MAAEREVDDEEMLAEWIGPGGVRLKGDEAMQRYLEVTADEALRAEALAQVDADMEPHQIPKSFFKSLVTMQKRLTERLGK